MLNSILSFVTIINSNKNFTFTRSFFSFIAFSLLMLIIFTVNKLILIWCLFFWLIWCLLFAAFFYFIQKLGYLIIFISIKIFYILKNFDLKGKIYKFRYFWPVHFVWNINCWDIYKILITNTDELVTIGSMLFILCWAMGSLVIYLITVKRVTSVESFYMIIIWFLVLLPIFKFGFIPAIIPFGMFMLKLFTIDFDPVCKATNNPIMNLIGPTYILTEGLPQDSLTHFNNHGDHRTPRINDCRKWFLESSRDKKAEAISNAITCLRDANTVSINTSNPLTIGVLVALNFQHSAISVDIVNNAQPGGRHSMWYNINGTYQMPRQGHLFQHKDRVIEFLVEERAKISRPTRNFILN